MHDSARGYGRDGEGHCPGAGHGVVAVIPESVYNDIKDKIIAKQ